MKKYHNLTVLENVDILELIEMINIIKTEEQEEKMWDLYCAIYPKMTKETFISYDDFKNPKIKPKKTKEEILNDVRLIMNSVIEEGGV